MSDDSSCVQIADDVWAYLRVPGVWGDANTGLVRGDGASAVIDTPWDTERTAEMLRLFAPHTAAGPVTEVVNTHADGDHWWGNAAMPAAARITTSVAALDGMRHEPGPGEIGRMTRAASLARRLPGPPGATAHYLCCIFDGVKRPSRVRYPDHAFTGEMTLEVGGRTLRLTQDGPAHTSGDVVVHVPDAGVVFTGDLLFAQATPILWHGPLRNWTAALERILGLGADVFVPGHGPLATADDVRRMHEYWLWVEATGGTHFAAGRDPLEAARAMLDERHPWSDWLHPDRLVISLHTHWRDLRGQPLTPAGTIRRARAFADAGALLREG